MDCRNSPVISELHVIKTDDGMMKIDLCTFYSGFNSPCHNVMDTVWKQR